MRLFVVENYAKLFLNTLYSYEHRGALCLHAFVVMPEHMHLLITPAGDKTLEREVQLIKGGYSHEYGVHLGSKKKSGSEVSRTIAFVTCRSSSYIAPTFIRIRSSADWCGMPRSTRSVQRFPDSVWIAGPQRLKPSSTRSHAARLKSCPSRDGWWRESRRGDLAVNQQRTTNQQQQVQCGCRCPGF
jgi:REP element-mobilizing transposase RayT